MIEMSGDSDVQLWHTSVHVRNRPNPWIILSVCGVFGIQVLILD